MRDLYSGHVNQRIQSGNLPHCRLLIDSTEVVHGVNFYEKARRGLTILQDNPDFLFSMVKVFTTQIQELVSIGQTDFFIRDFNLLINTEFAPSAVNLNGIPYKRATESLPFVTLLDQVLWYGIHAYDVEITFRQDLPNSDMEDLFFAWIYLLKLVQQKELFHRKTINLSTIDQSAPLYDLFASDSWDGCDDSYFLPLSPDERKAFESLVKTRALLHTELENEILVAKAVAEETQEAWKKFIEIVNNLSSREASTIARMVDTTLSKREKLGTIKEYYSVRYQIDKGYYPIQNENIPFLEVLEDVEKRFIQAPAFCLVQDSDSNSFRVYPLLFQLVIKADTYNSLYIAYHQFRLDPKKDNAKQFVELALSCLKRNLGIANAASIVSIGDMVDEFYQTTVNFVKQYSAEIDSLTFDTIQQDAVLGHGIPLGVLGIGAYEKHLSDIVSSAREELSVSEAWLYQPQSREQILEQLLKEKQQLDKIQAAINARQIVVSLNIIYMFCSALRIMLSNKRTHVDFSDKKAISNIRYELLDIDYMLIRKVYSNPGSMLRYRESTGVDAETISDLEVQEEEHRNILFFSELQDIINELTNALETQSTGSILEIKKRIQQLILQHPVCEFKEQFAEWLDSISDRISAALVNNCKSTGAHFDEIKQTLLTKLGPESKLLPPSTLASLATAEVLYEQYALSEFANKGFDYSCISALYYQAFEEAYNSLIWHGYVHLLNARLIDGKTYLQILDAVGKKNITDAKAKGYLDKTYENRKHYINYDRTMHPHTSIKPSCMYANFVILLEQVNAHSELDKFCDYIAEITGFTDSQSMFNDADFMKKLGEFTTAVKGSKDNRNNASHGGSAIDIAQCDADKKTVLNGLETVRKESLGLIQQLLYLMRNKPQ